MNPGTPSHAHVRSHAGSWLHRLLVQLVHQAARDIRHIPRWEDQSIHNLRKRMKKLQAMLDLAQPVIPKATMASLVKDVRDLKNLLSGPRDTLIMSKLANDLGTTMPAPRAQLSPTASQLRKALASTGQLLIAVRLLDLSHLNWDLVAGRFAKGYKSSRKAWQRAQEDPSPQNLHQWRKKVKKLYYQSTALEPWLHHPKHLRRTRKLGSLLGDCHDLDVFSNSAISGHLKPSKGWRPKVKARRDALLSRIQRRADKVFSRPARKIMAESRHLLS